MKAASRIAKALLEKKAVRVSMDPPFTWTSGIKSPIYCDNRLLIAFPEVRDEIVDEFCHIVRDKSPDYIAGTATAAIPWAAFVAQKTGLPMVYVRPEPKAHGTGKQVEGYLEPNKKVLLIEDLISTGGSSVKSAEALRKEGKATVENIVAIVTYELDQAQKAITEAGLQLTTLTTFTDLIEEAKKQELLTEEQMAMILEFKKDPEGWGKKDN